MRTPLMIVLLSLLWLVAGCGDSAATAPSSSGQSLEGLAGIRQVRLVVVPGPAMYPDKRAATDDKAVRDFFGANLTQLSLDGPGDGWILQVEQNHVFERAPNRMKIPEDPPEYIVARVVLHVTVYRDLVVEGHKVRAIVYSDRHVGQEFGYTGHLAPTPIFFELPPIQPEQLTFFVDAWHKANAPASDSVH